MEQDFLKKLTQITEANIGNPLFGVNELAYEMGMSRSSLFRKLHVFKGVSINQFIRETRLHRAMEIIQREDVTVAEVAYRTGFSYPAYFNTCFHEYYGYPPGEAKKSGNHDGEGVKDVKGVEDVKGVKDVTGVKETKEGRAPLVSKKLIRKWIKLTSTVFVIPVLALIFISIYWNTRPEKTIAVLPFENLRRDTALQPWVTGLQEQLVNDLAKIKVFIVRTNASTNRLLNSGKSLAEIGNELKVDYLINGTFDMVGDSVKIWIQVIKARTGDTYLPETYTRKMNDFFNLQTEIASDIAQKLNTALSPGEKKELDKIPTKNAEAYKYYLKGLYFADRKRGYAMATPVEFFQKAIDLDPRFALAYAGIAKAKIFKIRSIPDYSDETFEACKTAIDHALEIDPDLPAAHNALGNFYSINEDYGKALQEFEWVLKSHPNDVETIFNIGVNSRLSRNWEKAVSCFEKAIKLDPLNAPYVYELGKTFLYLREYAKAEDQFNRAIQMEPSYWMSFHGLVDVSLLGKGDTGKAREILENAIRWNPVAMGNVYDKARFIYQRVLIDLYEGKYAEALDQISQIAYNRVSIPPPYNALFQPKFWYFSIIYRLMDQPDSERSYYDSTRIFIEQRLPARAREDPGVISALGIAYAGLGNTGKALELGEKAINLYPISKNGYLWPYLAEGLAIIYMMVGKYPEALKILDELLSIPGLLTTRILELDPRWAPLKNLPGFKRLLKEYSGK